MPKSKKPPAKIRYEQDHPTVSFRLDLDTKRRLKDALQGQSFASFIKEALETKERKTEPPRENRTKGVDRELRKHLGLEPEDSQK